MKKGCMKQEITVKVTLPDPYYDVWQAIRAAHGLDENFLSFMASMMIKRTLSMMMKDMDFAE